MWPQLTLEKTDSISLQQIVRSQCPPPIYGQIRRLVFSFIYVVISLLLPVLLMFSINDYVGKHITNKFVFSTNNYVCKQDKVLVLFYLIYQAHTSAYDQIETMRCTWVILMLFFFLFSEITCVYSGWWIRRVIHCSKTGISFLA